MKVLHVASSDLDGGANKAAYRVHRALRAAGVDSRMRVQYRVGADSSVAGPPTELAKLWGRLRPRLTQAVASWPGSRDNALHTLAFLPTGLHRELNDSDADIVHLHWVGGEIISIAEIGRIRKPLVWTLHDMWAFCGTEHYTSDGPDARFAQGYRGNGRTGLHPDLDRWAWRRKFRRWKQPMHLVCPSRWLAECARRSPLMRQWPVSIVPYPIELEVYRPHERAVARGRLGLPTGRQLVLFGAVGGRRDPRKGFHHLDAALAKLASVSPPAPDLVIFGGDGGESGAVGFKTHVLGRLHDDVSLAHAFAAADVFVAPSEMDNLPNTVIEALACGTPCVAFAVGGMPDLIDHEVNGYLARPFDAGDLARGIQWVLARAEASSLRSRARAKAEHTFRPALVAARYQEIYRAVLEQHGAAPAAR